MFPDWDDIEKYFRANNVSFTRENDYFDVFPSDKSKISYEDAEKIVKWGIYNI
jgi:hypothetical protein